MSLQDSNSGYMYTLLQFMITALYRTCKSYCHCVQNRFRAAVAPTLQYQSCADTEDTASNPLKYRGGCMNSFQADIILQHQQQCYNLHTFKTAWLGW